MSSGKTHLLNYLRNHMCENHPEVFSETFSEKDSELIKKYLEGKLSRKELFFIGSYLSKK